MLSKSFARHVAIDPANVRGSLLRLTLQVTTGLGFLVYFPSVYVSFKRGMVVIGCVDTFALLTLLALLYFQKLPFIVRALTVCFIYYLLGITLLAYVGPICQVYLFAFALIAALLLGVKVGLGAALLSSVTYLSLSLLGVAAGGGVAGTTSTTAEVVVISINFAMVSILLTLAVGSVVAALSNALTTETTSRTSLDRERKLLRTLLDTLPDIVFTKDTSGRFVNCNPVTLLLFGKNSEAELAGKTVFDFYPRELAGPYHADDLLVMQSQAVVDREERGSDATGKPLWLHTVKAPLRGATGETVGLIGISRDITDRKRAEAQRDDLLVQLELQIERMPLAYVLTDRNFQFTRWNPAAERMFGFSEAEMLGRHALDAIVPAQSRARLSDILEAVSAGSMDAHGELENVRKDGSLISCEWHNTPMFDGSGRFAGVMSLAQDVTGRRKLEEQLRQSQKMEAVGQLAGGVAHDFNNLLSVVLSYSDLAIRDLTIQASVRGDIEEIRRAATRAAELTRQLLMFSRQQVIEPTILDLNSVVSSVEKMLRRLVGEDVEFTFVPGAIGRVRADQGSIEQVIMNLCVNARDAMPTGGKLTLETAEVTLDDAYAKAHLGVTPGSYLMLSVTDTGSGMDQQTLSHIFEPFFTTKETGKGTGLGLATVFGIVQQSGGTIWVYSEPGIGTVFKVYLPRVEGDIEEQRRELGQVDVRGSETVLLVEDEAQVRAVTQTILRKHGYTVLDAQNAGEALLLSEGHVGPIHLLLSDVVMPRMSGPALAKRLSPTRPEMRVLCMSGYTDDAAIRHGVIEAEIAYLQKPLTVETLTRKVRDVLDAQLPRISAERT